MLYKIDIGSVKKYKFNPAQVVKYANNTGKNYNKPRQIKAASNKTKNNQKLTYKATKWWNTCRRKKTNQKQNRKWFIKNKQRGQLRKIERETPTKKIETFWIQANFVNTFGKRH